MVKNPPAGDSSSILGWEGPLEKEMATDSCIVDWRVSRTEESGRLQVMGSHRVGHDWANAHIGSLAQPAAWCRQMLPEHGLKSCPGFQVRNCPGTLSTYARGYLSISRVIQTPSLHGRYCCISHSEEKARTPESERVSCPVVSSVWLFTTPWTAAHQAPLSTGFPRQEYWSGLPFPSPGDLPHPGIEPRTPALRTDSLLSEPQGLEPIRTQEKDVIQSTHLSISLDLLGHQEAHWGATAKRCSINPHSNEHSSYSEHPVFKQVEDHNHRSYTYLPLVLFLENSSHKRSLYLYTSWHASSYTYMVFTPQVRLEDFPTSHQLLDTNFNNQECSNYKIWLRIHALLFMLYYYSLTSPIKESILAVVTLLSYWPKEERSN